MFQPECRWNRNGCVHRAGLIVCLIVFSMTGLCPARAAIPPQQTGAPQKKLPASSPLTTARTLVQSGHPEAALSLLEGAHLSGREAADVHALKGICLAMLSRPVASAAEFDQALALRPNDATIYFSAGLASAQFDNLEGALERLETALRLNPRLPGLRYDYALVLGRAGRFSDSEKQVNIELAAPGARPEVLLALWKLKARDAYYQEHWEDTISAYRKVLAAQPDFAEGYAETGEALFFLNRLQESAAALRRARTLDPQNGTPYKFLGKIDQDAGRDREAIAEFEKSNQLRPGDQDVVYRLVRLYSKVGATAQASRSQQELKDLVAQNQAEAAGEAKAAVLNNTAIELEKTGNLSGALERYDEAAKADVANLVFQRNAALLLCRMGRPEEAIRRLRDILSLDPDDAETLQILAVAKELAAGNSSSRNTLPRPRPSGF